MSVLRLPVQRTVAVVSKDGDFVAALTKTLTTADRSVIAGTDSTCLEGLDGWGAEWRGLDVEAVVIDLGSEVTSGLDALDAVRRRDPHAYVIVLSRLFGALGTARIGANLLLEGEIAPEIVVDALTHRPRGRL